MMNFEVAFTSVKLGKRIENAYLCSDFSKE